MLNLTTHIKHTVLGAAAAAMLTLGGAAQGALVTIDFDTADNWTAGSGVITSYQTNHVYTESNWTFTGGDALRNTTAAQDGFPGAIGTYSWRLRDADGTTWTATYNVAGPIAQFGFDVRRWDNSPDPNWTVSYSTDGGTTFLPSVLTINNAYLVTSDWKTFSYTLPTPATVDANDFVVRVARTGGERIMIDNFTYTIPEPASLALLGLGGLMMLGRRRQA